MSKGGENLLMRSMLMLKEKEIKDWLALVFFELIISFLALGSLISSVYLFPRSTLLGVISLIVGIFFVLIFIAGIKYYLRQK